MIRAGEEIARHDAFGLVTRDEFENETKILKSVKIIDLAKRGDEFQIMVKQDQYQRFYEFHLCFTYLKVMVNGYTRVGATKKV